MRTITVFCGSNAGSRPTYLAAAAGLGRVLAQRGLTLVYGGASVGLMGRVADAALAAGGKVVGVIPEALRAKELQHRGLTELHVVDSMHARKQMMATLGDGFLALPGGVGTLEELFEVWTWAQLGIHRKPCAVLNVDGYFDPLLSFVDRAVEKGFVRRAYRAMLLVDVDPAALLARMEMYEPPMVQQWLGKEES
jgi:uncharacterized protein (TIGR00730 family)